MDSAVNDSEKLLGCQFQNHVLQGSVKRHNMPLMYVGVDDIFKKYVLKTIFVIGDRALPPAPPLVMSV